ncbi:DNA ligase [Ferrimonas lipolytica]|uniref:DNA ligase n=1 Tax=Ferrimonas lipolytica TaxID=2724191 RepID=A0A6H1U902_9GAMM|nr:DNA ligase [Ferrimonas lipolytica]QIZ75525.1 DNA ligase [Ferrimonas lipolytica]
MASIYSGLLLSGVAALLPCAVYAKGPDLMLAKSYFQGIDVSNFLISEKFDGMRAYWTGSKLVSRGGNDIKTPAWFIAKLPSYPLDGELWLGRGKFQELMSLVRTSDSSDDQWRQVSFMVFDKPMSLNPFFVRQREIETLVATMHQPQIRSIKQYRVDSHIELEQLLLEYQHQGAEGLILKRYDSPYLVGRSHLMLKMKAYQDAEAVVVEHIPGKGQFEGMMGSLLVERSDGTRFKLGSGFSKAQRLNPPEIGQVVTYRYNGLTDNGLPRFARFDRTFVGL